MPEASTIKFDFETLTTGAINLNISTKPYAAAEKHVQISQSEEDQNQLPRRPEDPQPGSEIASKGRPQNSLITVATAAAAAVNNEHSTDRSAEHPNGESANFELDLCSRLRCQLIKRYCIVGNVAYMERGGPRGNAYEPYRDWQVL